jgi:hypothetical protein
LTGKVWQLTSKVWQLTSKVWQRGAGILMLMPPHPEMRVFG